MHGSPLGRTLLGRDECVDERAGQPVAPPDHRQPNAVRHERAELTVEMRLEEIKEESHLLSRALPVVAGEGVERELFDADARAMRDDLADRVGTTHVSHPAGAAASCGPAAVAVHDDRQVRRNRGGFRHALATS